MSPSAAGQSGKALQPPLVSLPFYHLLNKKHDALAEKVVPIIKRKIAEGLLEKLYEPYK